MCKNCSYIMLRHIIQHNAWCIDLEDVQILMSCAHQMNYDQSVPCHTMWQNIFAVDRFYTAFGMIKVCGLTFTELILHIV